MQFEIRDATTVDPAVTTLSPSTLAELGWPDPEITAVMPNPKTDYRRVAFIPLTITVFSPVELPAGELVNSIGNPPAVKDGFQIAVFDWDTGDTIKEVTFSIPLVHFINPDDITRIKLTPGQPAVTFFKKCLLDITGIPNNNRLAPDGTFRDGLYGIYISCLISGLEELSLSTPARFGRYQLRHGLRVDVL